MTGKHELIQNINTELLQIPELYLNNLFQIIQTFRVNLPKTPEQISEENKLFMSLYGSWKSEKTGDELTKEIYSARNDKPRDIIL